MSTKWIWVPGWMLIRVTPCYTICAQNRIDYESSASTIMQVNDFEPLKTSPQRTVGFCWTNIPVLFFVIWMQPIV